MLTSTWNGVRTACSSGRAKSEPRAVAARAKSETPAVAGGPVNQTLAIRHLDHITRNRQLTEHYARSTNTAYSLGRPMDYESVANNHLLSFVL